MKRSRRTFCITFFLLVIFTLLRVVNLHTFTHLLGEDLEHCEYCEFIYQNEKNNSLSPHESDQEYAVSSIFFPEVIENSQYYGFVFKKSTLFDYVFNKPPPLV
ncbi:hypothetical protein [Aquimarina celericrescens]|uniref:Uncharacterized protein n=1 Tax=Aquimarina celericrescens TaxID=1964542 RepID=A0ABW5ARV7_9FLAO